MFYNYEIRNNNSEEILYLYLNMKYEFSNEFSLEDDIDLARRSKNFIQNNNIPFHGSRVYLIVDGIIVKSIDIANIIGNPITSSFSVNNFMVCIKFDDSSTIEVSLREYLISILFSYFNLDIHDEVLKCICILYSGYAYKLMKTDKLIISTNKFSNYKFVSYYKTIFPHFDSILKKFNYIISEVDSIFLGYNNDYILPFIHYSNGGRTLANNLYPYLSSVKSLWDMASPYYIHIKDISFQEVNNYLDLSLENNSSFFISLKNNSQRIILGNKPYTLKEIKKIFHLNSDNIYLIVYQDFLRIITIGLGNAHGLSIYGANEIAKNGGLFYHILNYYFPKTKLFIHAKEPS